LFVHADSVSRVSGLGQNTFYAATQQIDPIPVRNGNNDGRLARAFAPLGRWLDDNLSSGSAAGRAVVFKGYRLVGCFGLRLSGTGGAGKNAVSDLSADAFPKTSARQESVFDTFVAFQIVGQRFVSNSRLRS